MDDDGLADLLKLSSIEEVSTTINEFFLNGIIVGIQSNDRVLTCADPSVIESLAVPDRRNSDFDICCLINDSRSISRTNTNGRFARRIGSRDHTRTTRS